MPDHPIGDKPVSTVAALTTPRSGRGSARHAADNRHRTTGRTRDAEAIAFTAISPQDNRRAVGQAIWDAALDAIVAVSGDGVTTSVIQHTAGSGIPVRVIPAGSGNDTAPPFSRIPIDPVAAAEVIADGFFRHLRSGRDKFTPAARGAHPADTRPALPNCP
ncbi:diacylglycerol kinase family protein [Corynebacterium mendelii]|uniref:NAD(+)/NADH kinase n=1 Tax=Corynebacterium mendelii TaxID=2765362 RepID=A0A939DZD7_9CORY|nr:diacylglycerol kinase family protein [Corynebacterium mendelii]MBN9643635.1 NAD(+)/NADH kinase [Corynebacterium mendelii]